MPIKKKTESVIEQTEKVVKKAAKKVKEEAEEIAESLEENAEELVEEIKEAVSGEKPKKSTKKKTESSSSDKSDKLAKLKEKAEKLAKGIDSKEIDIAKEIKKKDDEGKYTLATIEDYLKSSIHLGTRAITPDMRPFVYKRRADSLAVFNTEMLDEKIKDGAEYLAKFAPNEILIVCKRDAGEKPVELFSKVTGIKAFVKQYPAGILTNPNLDDFLEVELLVICDPWTDKAALADAKRVKIPVLSICDTNNYTMGIDKIIPGNNKSAKSLGFIFYLLAKIYVEKRNLKVTIPPISEWVEGWDNLVPPK